MLLQSFFSFHDLSLVLDKLHLHSLKPLVVFYCAVVHVNCFSMPNYFLVWEVILSFHHENHQDFGHKSMKDLQTLRAHLIHLIFLQHLGEGSFVLNSHKYLVVVFIFAL